jgi:RNA polymerase sigma-70 factor (ECF subfamily)
VIVLDIVRGRMLLIRNYQRHMAPTRNDVNDADDLDRRAGAGEPTALAAIFARNRDRLRRMVRLRLDRRLRGRVDPSDVLQEAQIDIVCRAKEYAANPLMAPYLWLRFLTGQRLSAIHRKHFGAQVSEAGPAVSLHRGPMPDASSMSLAAVLLGRFTSPTHAVRRAETQIRLQEALNGMDDCDREVLILRHFEELSNAETAEVMGIGKTAACNRYIQALKRLKAIMVESPGGFDF